MAEHRFKWQQAQALADQGLNHADIMAEMQVSERQLIGLLYYARRRDKDGRRLIRHQGAPTVVERVFMRSTAAADRLRAEAARRRVSLSQLVDDLLGRVVEDDLFAAVLDD